MYLFYQNKFQIDRRNPMCCCRRKKSEEGAQHYFSRLALFGKKQNRLNPVLLNAVMPEDKDRGIQLALVRSCKKNEPSVKLFQIDKKPSVESSFST
jgi:hypothetical protein